MEKKIIRLHYRKIIDAGNSKAWDKYVFEDTYKEFQLQSQYYNPQKKYSRFSELLQHEPKADKLHFLVSAAVTGYLQQLNGIIPDITNNAGRLFLPFKDFRFEIVNSDIKNKSLHQVAINFYSEPLVWHDIAGNWLLVSLDQAGEEEETLIEMVSLQPFLSIYSLKTIENVTPVESENVFSR
jgi:hypothetical protein